MKLNKIIIGLFIFTLLFFVSCKCVKKNTKLDEKNTQEQAIPLLDEQQPYADGLNRVEHAIVYKTKKNYQDKVPIILSDDKSEVVSFPDPIDIYYRGELAYPTVLADGYLLDNRGINENVAFTNYIYKEYANLDKVPTKNEFMQHIIDNNPLVEIIDLGARAKFSANEVETINAIIKNDFRGYKRVKFKTTIVNK